MATLVDNPYSVPTMVEMLGRMNIFPQGLQTTNEIPMAEAMIDNINHTPSDIQHFFIKHEPSEARCFNGRRYEPMLDRFEYRLPSNFEIDPLLSFSDILSTVHSLDLSAHRVDDLSIQLDEMTIDDAGSSLLSLPEPIDNRCSATFFENTDSTYPTYANSSASPPAPSFYNFLEEAGIEIDQYEELLRTYSPDIEWEKIPLSVQEYQIQEMYLAQVGDLCHEMEPISMSQNSSGSVSPTVPVEFDMTMAQDQSNSLGLFNVTTEDPSLMPLDDLICIDSLIDGGRGEVESALWAPTSQCRF